MNIHWFRRDLRIHDNPALFHALQSGPTQCIFIFDTTILDRLEDKSDRRVEIIYQALEQIHAALRQHNSSLWIFYDKPIDVWTSILENQKIDHVFFNKDYEPYAIRRDQEVVNLLNGKGIGHSKYLDHLIFQPNEITKADGLPYTVFTPYSRRWKEKWKTYTIPKYPTNSVLENLQPSSFEFPNMEFIGFKSSEFKLNDFNIDLNFIAQYGDKRDIPSLDHTSNLSVYLRFGLVSIREIADKVSSIEKFLNELIWREFYAQIMYHFPESMESNFKKNYDSIVWSQNAAHFKAWCEGMTGVPIVDAGMHQLNQTGRMHNRVRMIVSSYLTKNLWIDWKWGERYFAAKLLDFELASNVGGWQWAASTGCDAVPYFRIFNPTLQAAKFDPKNEYIARWIPNYNPNSYLPQIVDYSISRDEAIRKFKHYLAKLD